MKKLRTLVLDFNNLSGQARAWVAEQVQKELFAAGFSWRGSQGANATALDATALGAEFGATYGGLNYWRRSNSIEVREALEADYGPDSQEYRIYDAAHQIPGFLAELHNQVELRKSKTFTFTAVLQVTVSESGVEVNAKEAIEAAETWGHAKRNEIFK